MPAGEISRPSAHSRREQHFLSFRCFHSRSAADIEKLWLLMAAKAQRRQFPLAALSKVKARTQHALRASKPTAWLYSRTAGRFKRSLRQMCC